MDFQDGRRWVMSWCVELPRGGEDWDSWICGLRDEGDQDFRIIGLGDSGSLTAWGDGALVVRRWAVV